MKTEYRINAVAIIALISFAVVCDGIQFLLDITVLLSVLSMFVAFVAFVILWLWFKTLGINYSERGAALQMITAAGSLVIEIVPIVDALPAITAGVVALIIQSRIQDSQKMKASRTTQNAMQVARAAQEKKNKMRGVVEKIRGQQQSRANPEEFADA